MASKRFRYLVECLSPAFTGLDKRQLRTLALYQRKMGHLQDLEIARLGLERFGGKHQAAEGSLRPFRCHLQRRRARSLRCFLQLADHLLEFWPPAAPESRSSPKCRRPPSNRHMPGLG